VTVDNKYFGYAKETAQCVDLAYLAMEEDIVAELDRSERQDRASLDRLLQRLHMRRAALSQFSELTIRPR
jgi:hypothetical protein